MIICVNICICIDCTDIRSYMRVSIYTYIETGSLGMEHLVRAGFSGFPGHRVSSTAVCSQAVSKWGPEPKPLDLASKKVSSQEVLGLLSGSRASLQVCQLHTSTPYIPQMSLRFSIRNWKPIL